MQKQGLWGGLIGFANGLFGSGGGTIGVLILERCLHLSPHKSHATILAIILPLSVLSAVIYCRKVEMEWIAILWLSVGGMVGGYVGASCLKKISNVWLHRLFGLCMLAAAVRMIL